VFTKYYVTLGVYHPIMMYESFSDPEVVCETSSDVNSGAQWPAKARHRSDLRVINKSSMTSFSKSR